uniref:Uncharacterized protein n=1 Tax=Siphoviridae sp. ctoMB99 TaxID=2826459 RepID=A0A8S5MZJ3_9CAUD|nr:MAG TPA: hypothetical protein [Siphoviridae sp. ctoMB99]
MSENCPYAYRKRGDVSVHCKKMPENASWCGHQYLCPQTKRCEATKQAALCPLRKEKNQ